MDVKIIFCVANTTPAFPWWHSLFPGINIPPSFWQFWLCQNVFGLRISCCKQTCSDRKTHFCLLVGLDFSYNFSLHQLLVWTAERYLVWSKPPQFPFIWHNLIPGVLKLTPVVLTILPLSNCIACWRRLQIWNQLASASGMDGRTIFSAVHHPSFPLTWHY